MESIKQKAERFLNEALEENPRLFLIDFSVDAKNHIRVVIDGDDAVSISDCMAVSRKIEHQMDPDHDDFSVEVTSSGVSQPLQIPRQFIKNVGRSLDVVLNDNSKLKADLVAANDTEIELSWKAREPKPVGKGKITVDKKASFAYDAIKEAKVMVIFNK